MSCHPILCVSGRVQVAWIGRGVGVQPSPGLLADVPPNVRPHPVLIAKEVELLAE
jgi:hypothetical protein